MTGRDRKGRDAFREIDLRLDGFLGDLGAALGEMLTRLDDGSGGEVRRTHSFETPRGTVRTEAGIRVRMGGFDVKAGPERADPAPPPKPAPTPDDIRPIQAEILDSDGHWSLVAELPGISPEGLTLEVGPGSLCIEARSVTRRYRGEVPLPKGLGRDDLAVSLQNGVLEISAAIGAGGSA